MKKRASVTKNAAAAESSVEKLATHRLTDIQPREVSPVDAGANKRVFLLVKSAETPSVAFNGLVPDNAQEGQPAPGATEAANEVVVAFTDALTKAFDLPAADRPAAFLEIAKETAKLAGVDLVDGAAVAASAKQDARKRLARTEKALESILTFFEAGVPVVSEKAADAATFVPAPGMSDQLLAGLAELLASVEKMNGGVAKAIKPVMDKLEKLEKRALFQGGTSQARVPESNRMSVEDAERSESETVVWPSDMAAE